MTEAEQAPHSVPRRTSQVWVRPNPLGRWEAARGLGGVVSPLLAGFSLAAIATLLTAGEVPRLADWAVASFSFATALMLFAMQFSFMALRHGTSPGVRLEWAPEAAVDRAVLERERLNHAADFMVAHTLERRAGYLYDLGLLSFLAGLWLLLFPREWSVGASLALAVATAALAVELWWVLGRWVGRPPRLLLPSRARFRDQLELSELDEVSVSSVIQRPVPTTSGVPEVWPH